MNDERINENLIVKLSFEFALQIVKYAELLEEKRKFVLANQLLKSGTSIGANIWEAQNSESKADFIHKMKISAKECEETKYWLLICKHSENYPTIGDLLDKIESIQKVLNKIIATTKQKIISR
ncbi:four helix bundle protein [Pedobacter helvus]|uniref:Four helix bundle protein n=1 Tax=Pedobacter helvus TaxID=2563444 RepID=A0ABW9JBX8_9SPHI|nr:four helix bundle protein [Pedobacter ureilyticus]